jgi:hypothetical protein
LRAQCDIQFCASLSGACYAARVGWIYGQAADIDFFTAHEAVTELTGLNSPQGGFNSDQLLLASPIGLFRHLLRLHGIHAGKPANAGLIQLNRFGGLPGAFIQIFELFPLLQQALSELFYLRVLHQSPPGL